MKSKVNLLMALSSLVLVSLQSFAKTPAERICSRIILTGDKNRCEWLIRGQFFDSRVTPVCAEMTFDSDKIWCLEVIKNRYFTELEQVNDCQDLMLDQETIQCLSYCSSRNL